ncbi:MAG: hypothetical protein L3J46_10000 [Kangiellaceae bacterium]|nr:hypothetical protein [Kangiellaceae bacterium]
MLYKDGAKSEDGRMLGTYLHGLFEQARAASSILSWASGDKISAIDWNSVRENELDRLADNIEEHLDMNEISKIIGEQNVCQ